MPHFRPSSSPATVVCAPDNLPALHVSTALLLLLCAALLLPACGDSTSDPPAGTNATAELLRDCGEKALVRSGEGSSQSCVEWSYDAQTKELVLLHSDAAFNCCAEALLAEVWTDGAALHIREREISDPCDCFCLYDIRIIVTNVEAGPREIVFEEPYRGHEDEELRFEAVLEDGALGSVCAARTAYPWGG